MVLTKVAQFTAVTTPEADTELTAVCPHPALVVPVLQVALTLAPAVRFTNPL
jgi:hypothetical protein